MGLLQKFSSREAELPENFLPKESKAFQGKLRFPQKFKGSYASKKFSSIRTVLVVLAAIKADKGMAQWSRSHKDDSGGRIKYSLFKSLESEVPFRNSRNW
jgi:hypothetical protein